MAQGSKAKYTSKQKRQASHIVKSAKASGRSAKTAKRIAWATVNKETGGAGKAIQSTAASKKGGQKGGKASVHANRRLSHKSTSHSSHASH